VEKNEIEKIEYDLLLDAIFQRYGYEFRHYNKPTLRRRIRMVMEHLNLTNISDLIPKILYDIRSFERLIFSFSITVTEMFRDPGFYKSIRDQILPYLRTYPVLKIWHAGCATGEEAYSLAILLKEEGLYDRSTIFATDYNDIALRKAKAGIYPISFLKTYTANYQASGGKEEFSKYYHAQYDSVILDQSLREKITFANHNLVIDGVFGEMNLIFCRNVLIYFDSQLQDRVLKLFRDSLVHKGYLCLGNKENIRFSSVADSFSVINQEEKVFRKNR